VRACESLAGSKSASALADAPAASEEPGKDTVFDCFPGSERGDPHRRESWRRPWQGDATSPDRVPVKVHAARRPDLTPVQRVRKVAVRGCASHRGLGGGPEWPHRHGRTHRKAPGPHPRADRPGHDPVAVDVRGRRMRRFLPSTSSPLVRGRSGTEPVAGPGRHSPGAARSGPNRARSGRGECRRRPSVRFAPRTADACAGPRPACPRAEMKTRSSRCEQGRRPSPSNTGLAASFPRRPPSCMH